jgi:hypothetical protein
MKEKIVQKNSYSRSNEKDMNISKYVFLEGKVPQYVIYKTELTAMPELFIHLKKLGMPNWEAALQDAVQNKPALWKPVFISGIGVTGGGAYDWVYAIMFGKSACFWSYDLGIGKDFIEIGGTCKGYRDTHSPDIGEQEPTYQAMNPRFKLDKENLKRINALKNEMDQEFLLKLSDDDEEFIETKVELRKYLKSFKKHKGGIYTCNWDDLEDLAGLSQAWEFTLCF